MTRTHDYQIISDTAPAIESRLATQAAEGWRPILASYESITLGHKQKWKIVAKVLWWIGKSP
jgi:hypothetical protein